MYAAATDATRPRQSAKSPLDELLLLDAGERLDAAIERLVFGRCVHDEGAGRWSSSVPGGRRVSPRPFSTSMDAARLLIGHLEGGFIPAGGDSVDVVINGRRHRASGPTHPLAICRAVLKWRGEMAGEL